MRRALLLVVMISVLAACRDEAGRAPFAESRTPPGLAGRFFPPEGWAWGYVQSGAAPPQRYGVAGPRGVPRGRLLIIVGSGETAEAWFETVADLNAQGITVWVLERAGQAGSGRFAGPRDLIHAPSFDADMAAARAMVRLVIRPAPGAPLVLMGQGDGAVAALGAAEQGLPVDGLVLSAPAFAPTAPETLAEGGRRRLGLVTAPASGWSAWRRDGPDAVSRGLTHDRWRGEVQQAWQVANPDLRMSGDSIGWRQAFRDAGEMAQRRAPEVSLATLMILPQQSDSPAQAACAAMPDCRIQRLAGARPALHLESDRYRSPWLKAIDAFLEAR